jgi:hypothetical protein
MENILGNRGTMLKTLETNNVGNFEWEHIGSNKNPMLFSHVVFVKAKKNT